MLHRHIDPFLDYCRLAEFSIKTIEALIARLKEFQIFLKTTKIRSVKKMSYRHLIEFDPTTTPHIVTPQNPAYGDSLNFTIFNASPDCSLKIASGLPT
ncbi:hypothetical protein ACFLZM_07210 [Thermodesulfobacteriota bacterium]